MPILRDFRCVKCALEFERIHPICPACNTEGATRIFLHPPRISNGYSKKTDAILQHQFNKLNITNFSNSQTSGPNRVSWKPRHPTGRANSGGQPLIEPMVGIQGLEKYGFTADRITQTFGPDRTKPYAVPRDVGAAIPLGVPIGGKPTELYKQTNVVGGIDASGKQVVRVR
jgi:hypothetical protein